VVGFPGGSWFKVFVFGQFLNLERAKVFFQFIPLAKVKVYVVGEEIKLKLRKG